MVNVRKVEALVAAGRMQPPGLAEVERARADGRWQAAYAAQKDVTVPPDLEAALAADEPARTAFAALGKTERYRIIVELLRARQPETRARRAPWPPSRGNVSHRQPHLLRRPERR